eukprot:1880979-Rhodomonas_salina.1
MIAQLPLCRSRSERPGTQTAVALLIRTSAAMRGMEGWTSREEEGGAGGANEDRSQYTKRTMRGRHGVFDGGVRQSREKDKNQWDDPASKTIEKSW